MKLSIAQQEVIEKLKQGWYVWTNEGSNLKAWIGDYNSNKLESLRVRTVEILFNEGYIEEDKDKEESKLFRYKLQNNN